MELFNKLLAGIYDKFIESYIYVNIYIDEYFYKKELLYTIRESDIVELDTRNEILGDSINIQYIDNKYNIYSNEYFNINVKHLDVALIQIQIIVDGEVIVESLDISEFINQVYIHGELELTLHDWFLIFKKFLNVSTLSQIVLLPETKLTIEFNIIDMNGEITSHNILKY